jgi:hypothetical protein
MARQLTASGKYVAALVSMEVGAAFNKNPGAAEAAILDDWRATADWQLPPELQPPVWPTAEPGARLRSALQAWAKAAPYPLVLFLDEIDALQDVALISVLRQLRAGYPGRPEAFPWSLALIGMRDVRDYKMSSGGGNRLHTASPFNIKVRSLTLGNFSADDLGTLYHQHTAETGQTFQPEAVRLAFDLTQGQPWLVNALAKIVVEELVPDASRAIAADDVENAREILIERQETHLDSLAERLREARVRQIIEPMLVGRTLGDVVADDLRFVQDLGLCRRLPQGGLEIANPIYREVIPRVLAGTTAASLPMIQPVWLKPDGSLDTNRLLEAFLTFWKQHGQPLLASAPYHEIAPHLVMMAFLHRVVNGGGTLEREYAIGSGRMDLCLRYREVTLAMELKVWRDGRPDPLNEGLVQIDSYLNGLGLDSGWLVIFDRRKDQPPIDQRTATEPASTASGKSATVIRA